MGADLEPILKPSTGLLQGDQTAGQVQQRAVVGALAFPADQQRAKSVVPRVGALDDPSTRAAATTAARRLSALTNVRPDAATTNGGVDLGKVVALVQA